MAEATLKFFLQRLKSLCQQDGEIVSPLKDPINQIVIKLKAIQPYIEDAKSRKEEQASQSWARELIDTVHDADNCIDEFIARMHSQDGSDPSPLIVEFQSKLQQIEARLVEILRRKARIFAMENFKSTYRNLPYYLKSSLMYCCIFPENCCIGKGRLVRMLVAEGLVEEHQGEIVEEAAEKYIDELISMGMLHVDQEQKSGGRKFKINSLFREFLLPEMEKENFATVCSSPDAQIPPTARRVSIHEDDQNFPPNLNYHAIRSLLMSGIGSLSGPTWDCLRTAICCLKLLRVLDFEGVKMKSLPDEVGELIHLRYLGLKKSELIELPESLSNLQNLQTLDIRWCGDLTALQDWILKLVRLRNLIMYKNSNVSGMKVPTGIGKLKDIQTLTGLYAGDGIAAELSGLTQMRKLHVMDVEADHTAELYASIMNMVGLVSLSLEAKAGYPFPIKNKRGFPAQPILPLEGLLLLPPHIKKLCLEGRLETIPPFFISMENLSKLRLGFSHLEQDPARVLQMLPNLKELCLWHAYDGRRIGREFCAVGGFPKLEDLTIASHLMEKWTEIEEGAFPSLKYLRLHNCLRLRMLPEGLQHVTTLQKLYLMPLLDELEQKIRPGEGEENYKIAHIPQIQFITTSTVERLVSEENPAVAQPESSGSGSAESPET